LNSCCDPADMSHAKFVLLSQCIAYLRPYVSDGVMRTDDDDDDDVDGDIIFCYRMALHHCTWQLRKGMSTS